MSINTTIIYIMFKKHQVLKINLMNNRKTITKYQIDDNYQIQTNQKV